MEILKDKINNKIDLQLIKTEQFKFVNIDIVFLMELDYSDIAPLNLLASILTTRNNKYKSSDKFAAFLEENYGMLITSNYYNRGNIATFHIISSLINSRYSMGENLLVKQIEIIKDCLFDPYLNEDSLQEVKRIYIQKLKEQLNRKTYILQKQINNLLGTNTPYGVSIESNIEDINNVTLERLEQVYHKLLNSAYKIYVCGDVNSEEVISLFSSFNLENNSNAKLDISYLRKLENFNQQVYESKFLQSAVSLIYECDINYNDPLFYALKLFLEMFNYDLFNIIREKYNFCYYVYAFSNNYLNIVQIVSEIESKNLDKFVELCQEIIEGYNTNFDSERFNVCKEKILTYLKTSLDSPANLIDLYFGMDFSNNVSSIEELENNYKKVSEEEVKEVSKMMSLKLVALLKEASNNG